MNWNSVGAVGILLISAMIAVTVLCLLVMAVSAEDQGYLTGRQWLALTFDERMTYTRGAIETAISEGLFTCPAIPYAVAYAYTQAAAEKSPNELALWAVGTGMVRAGCQLTDKGKKGTAPPLKPNA